jgi:hypothetical protein
VSLVWPIFKENAYMCCKDYGTLKRNFMPWLQVTKIVCVFYLVSLHINLPLTPTPFIIDRDVTGVWEPRNRSRRTHRVSGGTAQLFLNLGTRRGVWSASCPGCLYPRERPGTHCTGGWVGPGAGLDRCGKYRPTGIRSPGLPACSESLYRLRYPGYRSLG